jgi:cytoskeletal protein CcmA (bactofilin family)
MLRRIKMKKFWVVFTCLLLSVVLLSGTVIAIAADENSVIKAGEMVDGDFITGGVAVLNEGTILGDFIAAAQNLTNTGEVEGDLIAGASQISVNGRIGGSLRVAAADLKVNCTVERNATIFGSTLTVGEDTVIKRNAYYLGGIISASGRVMGNTSINAGNVTLGGIYEGDVKINNMTEGSTLNILPGTVIKGKLTYEGVTKYEVPSDVQVGSYSYIRIEPVNKTSVQPAFSLWSFIKRIFTLLVYYLFALLIYKIFPRFFVRSGDFIEARPLSSAGIGIATLGSLVAGSLALILLLILAVFIIKGSVVLFGSLVFLFVTVVTILFADIPVSMWLGNIITNRRLSVPARLAAGLATVSAIKIILELLKNLQGISTIARIILYIVNISIWILGTGALMKSVFEVSKSANRQAEAEEFTSETSENAEM